MSGIWNWLTKVQQPVVYEMEMTNNNFTAHKNYGGLTTIVFVVKQLRYRRIPRRPFLQGESRCYQVEAFRYVKGEFTESSIYYIPELCHWMFKNTKAPHACAINLVCCLVF